MTDFVAPTVDWAALSPVVIVLRAAVVGVLVEAFVPARVAPHGAAGPRGRRAGRRHRRGRRAVERRRGDRRHGRARRLPAGRRADAGPAGHHRAARAARAADHRRPHGDGRGRVRAQRRRRAGLRLRGARAPQGRAADRDLPAGAVRHGRHADLPRHGRPADAVRRARGALPAAVPAHGHGPPPPPALAGGVDEVLPARRVLLGAAALRHRAGLRLLAARCGTRRSRRPRRSRAAWTACCSSASVLVLSGLLFKVGAVPFHTWTPDVYQGAPTPITGFMAACTKVAAFGALLRIVYTMLPGLAVGPRRRAVDRGHPHDGRRHGRRAGADRHEARARRTPRSRTPGSSSPASSR